MNKKGPVVFFLEKYTGSIHTRPSLDTATNTRYIPPNNCTHSTNPALFLESLFDHIGDFLGGR